MSKRTITLKLTTQKDLVVRESEARTFGELKADLSDIKWDGMRVVERTSKNTLQMDDAILPATDVLLFVVPEKVKSGAVDIETATYNELRSEISRLNKQEDAGIPIEGKIDELRNGLREYYGDFNTPEDLRAMEVEEATVTEILTICKNQINDAIDTLIKTLDSESLCDDEEYVIKTTVKDLENEVSEIKKSLNL